VHTNKKGEIMKLTQHQIDSLKVGDVVFEANAHYWEAYRHVVWQTGVTKTKDSTELSVKTHVNGTQAHSIRYSAYLSEEEATKELERLRLASIDEIINDKLEAHNQAEIYFKATQKRLDLAIQEKARLEGKS